MEHTGTVDSRASYNGSGSFRVLKSISFADKVETQSAREVPLGILYFCASSSCM